MGNVVGIIAEPRRRRRRSRRNLGSRSICLLSVQIFKHPLGLRFLIGFLRVFNPALRVSPCRLHVAHFHVGERQYLEKARSIFGSYFLDRSQSFDCFLRPFAVHLNLRQHQTHFHAVGLIRQQGRERQHRLRGIGLARHAPVVPQHLRVPAAQCQSVLKGFHGLSPVTVAHLVVAQCHVWLWTFL